MMLSDRFFLREPVPSATRGISQIEARTAKQQGTAPLHNWAELASRASACQAGRQRPCPIRGDRVGVMYGTPRSVLHAQALRPSQDK